MAGRGREALLGGWEGLEALSKSREGSGGPLRGPAEVERPFRRSSWRAGRSREALTKEQV